MFDNPTTTAASGGSSDMFGGDGADSAPINVDGSGAATTSPDKNKEKKPLAALSSTLSASSSLSGSTNNSISSPTMSASRFKHYQKPTVSDSPELVALCESYVENKDIEGLARLARNRGLPPQSRQYAWPLLLDNHPYVLNSNIIPEYPDSSIHQQKVPYNRVKNDIARYRKRLKPTATTNNSTTLTSPNENDSSGSNNTTTNLDKLSDYLSEDEKFLVIEKSIVDFLGKWGNLIPYESGITWAAFGLSEWINPIYEMQKKSPADDVSSESSTPPNGNGHNEVIIPVGLWSDKINFSQIFENFLLVMFHSPTPKGDGPYGPCDSPITDRISSFLTVFRKLLPEIADHFNEEDVLANVGGDEWIIWWIKWLGAKVWNSHDRARIWDMYLGWRPEGGKQESNYETEIGIGTDPFWDVMELESTHILDPHIQHLFVCIALLKSNKHTLLELDQSEIREFLIRVSKSKDIESIIQEAGECYRSWKWLEDNESL